MPRVFADCQPGQTIVTDGRKITEAEVVLFAAVTGDWNPLHTDAEFARASAFGERVAHGLLSLTQAVTSLIEDSAWPVDGVLRGFDNVRFLRPVRFGDTLRLSAEVVEADSTNGSPALLLRFQVLNQTDEAAIAGRMLLACSTDG